LAALKRARQTVERYTTLNGGDAVSGPPLESNCDNKEEEERKFIGTLVRRTHNR
jgi:hypothetical protein